MRKGEKMSEEIKLKISKSRIGKYKGSDNPNWKNGRIKFPDGRLLIYCPYHPYPNFNKTHVFEYRLIMERELKRFLLPGEIVHHLDGDVTNNSASNLMVMTQSEHALKHYMSRKKNKLGQLE